MLPWVIATEAVAARGANLHVGRRLVLRDLRNDLRAFPLEMVGERPEEVFGTHRSHPRNNRLSSVVMAPHRALTVSTGHSGICRSLFPTRHTGQAASATPTS